jgi:hypothetical protein
MKRFGLVFFITIVVLVGSSTVITSQAEKLFWINLGI